MDQARVGFGQRFPVRLGQQSIIAQAAQGVQGIRRPQARTTGTVAHLKKLRGPLDVGHPARPELQIGRIFEPLRFHAPLHRADFPLLRVFERRAVDHGLGQRQELPAQRLVATDKTRFDKRLPLPGGGGLGIIHAVRGQIQH